MIKKRFFTCIIFALIALLLVSASIAFLEFNTPVSANEYMNNTVSQRMEYAKNRYKEFYNNPNETTDVLVSFNKVDLEMLDEVLPENCEIITVYHFFTDGEKTVTGAYASCKGKVIEDIKKAYYTEIHDLIKSKIDSYEEEKNAIYKQYMLDYSISEKDFDPDQMCGDWEYDGESLEKLNDRIDYNMKHLRRIEDGVLDLSGVRISAKNSDIVKLLESNYVLMVEILDFDNNNIVAPAIVSD